MAHHDEPELPPSDWLDRTLSVFVLGLLLAVMLLAALACSGVL